MMFKRLFLAFATIPVVTMPNLADQPAKTSGQHPPLDPQRVVETMQLPEGFKATVFAAEDDVLQPLGFCIDHRGRLWVAENFSYPTWSEKGTDRITIFEDTNNDGVHDKRTVFAEGFGYLTGVLTGHDGVWVANAPHLLFFPDRDHDDRPDGEPEIHLEGWNWKGIHNVLNGLTWGPDGWIYGANGITVDSDVKVAGAPESDRIKLSCSIWRYHPQKRKFETFAVGTTNPWGIDFNETGQLFFSTSVTPHFNHGIQGAHYVRMHGQDHNPYTFELIRAHTDHLHYASSSWNDWTKSRDVSGVHGDLGGGHAHAGAMIYYGDQFPAEYRGTIFFNNIHGTRINNDSIERNGSGFVARHRPDFMKVGDKWYRGITLNYGPDGSVYTLDWSDTDECHDLEAERDTGRIYRISYAGSSAAGNALGLPLSAGRFDMEKLANDELVSLQLHTNEFLVRHARQILQYRTLEVPVQNRLKEMLAGGETVVHRLRALWTLHITKGLDETMLTALLSDREEQLRAWAIQLLCEDKQVSQGTVVRLTTMAKEDASPLVRLYLASALQRLPLEHRWGIVEGLIARGEDATDHNLPLMVWYGMEPLIKADTKRAVGLMAKVKIPKIRQFITRRLAS